jgi:hypothetical protein
MLWRRIAIGLLGLAAQEILPAQTISNLTCDTNVRARSDDPLSYRLRGDRCEGTYAQNVSGSSRLLVASFMESFETMDTSSTALRVEWTPPGTQPVGLRGYSLRPGLFYRMETVRPASSTSYTWPTDVLRGLDITNADIGVVATTAMTIGGIKRDVLVPLRVSQHKAAVRSPRYRLTVWPSVELKDVFVTLALAGPDGKPKTYVQRDENIAYGFYPAERGIEIPLKAVSAPGTYVVRIAATLPRGGAATQTFMFYHAGR